MRRMYALSMALALMGFACDEGDDGLPAPSRLVVTGMAADQITLAWTDGSGGTLATRVYRGDGASPSAFTMIAEKPALLTSHADDTVTSGATYTYYVVSTDGTSESSRSNLVTVKAEAPYVTIVEPTSSDTLTVGQYFTIQWQTNIPGFDARIYLSTNGPGTPGDDTMIRQSSPAGSTSFNWHVGYDWRGTLVVTPPQSNCTILLHHYDNPAWSDESEVFSIQ